MDNHPPTGVRQRLSGRLAAAGLPQPPADWYGHRVSHVWRDTSYLLTSLPIALVAFCAVLNPLLLSFGTLVMWIGIPLAAGTLIIARGFASFERRRLAAVTGSTIDARYRETPPVHGITRWSLIRLRDPQTWLDALHSVVQLPLAVVTWSVTLVWWAAAISGPTYIVWARFLPDARPIAAPAELLTWVTRLIVGVAAGVTLPWVLRTATWAHQALASMLLASGSAEALAERIAQLEGNKAAATRAEVQSLRRLERDIHDGPQQSLVRLTMDIASAERAVGRDDETALRLLASARTVATDALAELRALSRGIAPPVLAERGLRSAIESLAGRTLVPTQVTWNASVDLGVGAETTAYFVVAEALANAAKHAQPSAISLAVSAQDGRLVVTVSDDGLGGAHMSKGHGLAGLAERVAGAGGTLTVADAVSGGTVVTAEVPCA